MREAKCVHSTDAMSCTVISFPAQATRRGLLSGAVALLAPAAPASGTASLGRQPDAELIHLLAAFDAIEREIEACWARGTAGYILDEDEREAAVAVLEHRQAPLLERALCLHAQTAAGWQARARTLQAWDDKLTAATVANAGEYWGNRMLAALVRDLTAGAA